MSNGAHLLLLAGSAEAREVASALAQMPVRVTASVYDGDHWSGPLAVPTRSGGFGGDAGFSEYLKAQAVTAVLDATHPFAARVSARSWRICQQLGVAYTQLDRPEWAPELGDDWIQVDTAADAATLTKPQQRYFVTTGRETLEAFANATDRSFVFRRLGAEPVTSRHAHMTFCPGEGPFSVAEETALFQALRIDGLICKNAGGMLSRTKLDAARALGLPVILLRRPPPTGAPVIRTSAQAVTWVRQTCL